MRETPTHPIADALLADPAIRRLADSLRAGRQTVAVGVAGSSAPLVAAAAATIAQRPLALVVAHLDEADEAVEEISAIFPRDDGQPSALRLPALEVLPGEAGVALDLFAERLAIARRLHEQGLAPGQILVCPVQALMQGAPTPDSFDRLALRLRVGLDLGLEKTVLWLDAAGYERVDAVEEAGQYAVRGGILDVFAPAATVGDEAGAVPVRIDFFGDEIDSITEFDLETMGSDRRIDAIELVGASLDTIQSDEHTASLLTLLPKDTLGVIHETLEVTEQARGYFERIVNAKGVFGPPAVFKALRDNTSALCEINQFSAGSTEADARIDLPVEPLPMFAKDAAEAVAELGAMTREQRVVVVCQKQGERDRLLELVAEFAPGAPIETIVSYLHRGFVWGEADAGPKGRIAFIPHHELLHRFGTKRRVRRLRGGRAMDAFLDLKPGDYVVHADHGVAKFVGLRSMSPKAPPGAKKDEKPAPEEFLTLEFAGNARLHVPATQIEQVQKYVGGHGGKPPLSTLGGKKWQHQKEKTSEAVRELAAEMLRVQAARASQPGVRYPADTTWQKEFEAEFPYDETEDQLAALAQIKKDMTSERPMDRLLCGDVGYGKTELAIRAAFKAAEFGKQVAVLVPTTVLAEQHARVFSQRFAAYPFRVEALSRMRSAKEQNAVLAALRKGQVDIIIGTHRLLSKDVRFADLGLVIVDEEQKFGVEHKQKLLSLRMTVDVLTLSATPIPRTLHMSLLGLRDISSLTTPPVDRRAVVTEVIPFNEKRVRQAMARELNRGGQIFFVHNRVHNIKTVADEVQKLAPDARIVVGHGQMGPKELEEVMMRFLTGQADILVSTTIIESGIDIPTANTMFINDADRFGLAELHQLRGRVGRYKHRAYCYMLLPVDRPVNDKAAKRLRAIEEFSMLGAGFKIAMRDLEIRGAGNLLGPEQSGHIAAVGYDMYCRLLEQATRELRNESTREPTEMTLDLGVTGSLPKSYIPSDSRRMEAYRRVARARTFDELDKVASDLRDAYGEPPSVAKRLLDLAEIRIGAFLLGVRGIVRQEQDIVFRASDPGAVQDAMAGAKGTLRIVTAPGTRPGGDIDTVDIFYRPPANFLEGDTLLTILRRRLRPREETAAAV